MKIAITFVFFNLFQTIAHADRLVVYAIRPPQQTQWESPRSLLRSTIVNSAQTSYSPSGHVMIRLEAQGKIFLTSMASAKKGQTFLTTLRQGLGLSSLYYDFNGTLDSAETSADILTKAFRDQRAAEIDININNQTSKQMVEFLEHWIRYGSFRHYKGGEIASTGFGAGCADFVMWFMNRALQGHAPLKVWVRELYLPKDLLEHTSPVEINRRTEWAKNERDGKFYMIPDPELLYGWIVKKSPIAKRISLSVNEMRGNALHFSAKQIFETGFQANYAIESEETVQEILKTIQLPN